MMVAERIDTPSYAYSRLQRTGPLLLQEEGGRDNCFYSNKINSINGECMGVYLNFLTT